MPSVEGHTLVITKEPAEGILDLSDEGAAALIATTQKVARAVKTALAAPGIMLVQLNGHAAGQSIPHIHFHVLPRRDGLDLKLHGRGMVGPDVLSRSRRRSGRPFNPARTRPISTPCSTFSPSSARPWPCSSRVPGAGQSGPLHSSPSLLDHHRLPPCRVRALGHRRAARGAVDQQRPRRAPGAADHRRHPTRLGIRPPPCQPSPKCNGSGR